MNFTHDKDDPGSLTAIKFPKYLKKLKSLTLTNIWHRDFTETLFDMASQRRLKSLNLQFIPDLPLPNFCEALKNFKSLELLSLQDLNFSKINDSLFFEYIRTAPCLLRLHLSIVQ